jgi:long-chain acyl-CoA synthetase
MTASGPPPTEEHWSTVVPNTAQDDRGDIRRYGDPLRNPELGFKGCQTLYECFRRGQALNPLGACLGFRAVSTSGLATPYIYSSYTEVLARVNAFAAGLETLNLIPANDDGMVLVRFQLSFFFVTRIFCVFTSSRFG